MYLAIFDDSVRKITRYYYEENGQLYFDEYSKHGSKKCRIHSLYEICQLLGFVGNHKFLEKDGKYDVYVDTNNLKHYFENGKENYHQFFLHNGQTCIFHNSEEDSEEEEKINISSLVKTIIVRSALGFVLGHSVAAAITSSLGNYLDSHREFDSNTAIEIVQEDTAVITKQDLVDCIQNNTNLPDKYKTGILESGILDVALKYYDARELKILHEKKLKDLKIQYGTDCYIERVGCDGYYSTSTPDTIYIREDNEFTDDVFYHEFIHLMQSYCRVPSFIDEPLAELMSNEYFGCPIDAYLEEIYILKNLILTVGSSPILRTSIGGDSSELEGIIRSYMTKEEANVMLNGIANTLRLGNDDFNQDKYEEVNLDLLTSIHNLYQNIYGDEQKKSLSMALASSNANVISNEVNDGFYTKEDGTISFIINSQLYDSLAHNLSIVNVEDVNSYGREITQSQYEYFNQNKEDFLDIEVINLETENGTQYFMVTNNDAVKMNDNWKLWSSQKKVTAKIQNITKTEKLEYHQGQSVEKYVDQLIEQLVEETNEKLEDETMAIHKKGYGNYLFLGILSIATTILIAMIGVLYFMNT